MITRIITAALLLSSSAARFAAFDGDTIELDKTAPIRDGKLVYQVNGKEELIDPSEVFSARSRITALNNEARGHRTGREAAEASLKAFEGIDAKKAKEALELVGKLDQKKLIDAGEVDRVREEIKASFTGQLKDATDKAAALQTRLNNRILGDAFSRSKYLGDNLAVPVDVIEATFRDLFTVDDNGNITAKDRSGNQIFSRDPNKSGTHADFEEAIKIILDAYPNKDKILKGTGQKGSGTNPGDGGNRGVPDGVKTMKRSDFEAGSNDQKAAWGREMQQQKLRLVD